MSSNNNNNINDTSDIAEATRSKKLLLQLVSAAMIREPAVAKESASFKLMKTCVDNIAKVDPEFILKMALYVRTDLGLRGSANTLAAFAALNESCRPFLKAYISHLCKLPTDWIQIAEFSRTFGDGQTLPNALRKALVSAFGDFDEHSLAKYNKESSSKKKEKKKREAADKERKKKMADAALKNRGSDDDDDSSDDDWGTDSDDSDDSDYNNNKKKKSNKQQQKQAPKKEKTPPKPFTIKRLIEYLHISTPRYYVMCILGLRYPATEAEFDKEGLGENGKRKFESERADKRMRLQVPKTWETQLAERGNTAEVWQDLIDSGLPFMAMLRNLRNVIIAGVDEPHHNKIIGRLENEDQIANSRQFPYRFFSAFESLKVDFKAIFWQPGEKEEFERIKRLQSLFAKQVRAQKNGTLEAAATNARNRAVAAAVRGGGGRGRARGVATAVSRGRGRAVAVVAPTMIEPPLKPGEKPPPKKKDIPATGLPSEQLFERYNSALNTAVKHATNNNIRPISGRTFVVIVVREGLMKNVGAGGGGVASTRTYLDLALLLGLMFRYGCEDPTILLCGPELKPTTDTADDAWQPDLPRDGKLLDNLTTLRQQTTDRMGKNHNSDKRVFPYPTLQKVIDNAEPLDCLVIIDSCEDDYAVPPRNNSSGVDTPYANLYQMLNLLRDKVNPDLLYVSVDICGQPKAPAVTGQIDPDDIGDDRECRDNDLNVKLTGFSDTILRFVAERGESPLAYIERIDEIKKLDVVEARKRDEEAIAQQLCAKVNSALQPKLRLLQTALDTRKELLSEENSNNSDVDVAEAQFRDASFIARISSTINSSKIDRPLSYFTDSTSATSRKIKTTLRCFVSSTFSDMLNERKALVQEVFPTVRRVLMERGIAIQLVEVDMRWGITDAMVHREDALNVCLNEVARCAPLFVSLVGARRGYAPTAFNNIKPISSEVDESEFAWLLGNDNNNKKQSSSSAAAPLSPTISSVIAAQNQAANNKNKTSSGFQQHDGGDSVIKPSPEMSITRLEFLQAIQSRKNYLHREINDGNSNVNPKLVVLLRDHGSVLGSGVPQNQLHWFKNENQDAATAIGDFALDISRAVGNQEAVSACYRAPFSRVDTTPQIHQSNPTCPVELDMTHFKQVAIEKILESVFKAGGIQTVSNSRAKFEYVKAASAVTTSSNNSNNNKNNKNNSDAEAATNNKLDSVVLAEQSLQQIQSHQVASISVGREEQIVELLKHLTKMRTKPSDSNVTLVSGHDGKSSFIHRVMWQLISGLEMMKNNNNNDNKNKSKNNNNKKAKKGQQQQSSSSTTATSDLLSTDNVIIFHHDFSFGSGAVASCVLRLVKTLISRLSLEDVITASTNTVSECLAVLPQIYTLVGRRRHMLYVFLTNTASCIDTDGLVTCLAQLIPPTTNPSLNFVVEVSSASSSSTSTSSASSSSGSDKFAGALRVRAAIPNLIQLPDLDKSEKCQVLHMHLQTLGKSLMESAAKGKFVSPLLRKNESGKATYLVSAISNLALFSTHDTLMNDIRQLGSSTRAIQSDLLSKLENNFGFSKSLVEDVLATIVLSQKVGGISERDLYYSVTTDETILGGDQQQQNQNQNQTSGGFSSSASSSFGTSSTSSAGNSSSSSPSSVQEVRRLLCVLERGIVWRNGVVDIALPALSAAITKRYLDRTPTVVGRHRKLANYYYNSLPTAAALSNNNNNNNSNQQDDGEENNINTPQLQYASPRSVVAMLFHALGASNQTMLEKIITNISCLETAIQGGFLPLLFNLVDQLDFKFRVLAKKVTPFTVFLRKNQHILSEYPKLTLQSASHDQSTVVRKAAQLAIRRLTQMTSSRGVVFGNKLIDKFINNQSASSAAGNNNDDFTTNSATNCSSSITSSLFGGDDDTDDDTDISDVTSIYSLEDRTMNHHDRRKQLATKLSRALWQNVSEHGEMDCAQTFIPSAGNGLTCVASNEAGTIFTVGCKDGNAYSYDVIDGTSRKYSTPSMVTAIFHMRNAQRQLLVGCDDGIIRIFSRDGSQTHQCVGHRRTVKQITCTPDNRNIFSAATDGTVRVWTFAGARGNNLRCLETRRGHNSPVTCVAVHQQGSGYCVSGGWDGRICIWNQGNRDAAPTWVDLSTAVTASASSTNTENTTNNANNSNSAAVTTTTAPAAASSSSSTSTATIRPSSAIRGVAFAPTMIVNIVAVTYDGQMHIYDVAAGHLSASFPFAHNGIPISSISYQGDGKKLVTADASGCAKIWRSGVNGTLFDTVTGHRLPATGIACHPTHDGNFATVSQDGTARFWEVKDIPGEPRNQALHAGAVTCIASGVSHNTGSLIYSASRDRTVACRPSLVEGESQQAKVAFRVLAEQTESPVVRLFTGHKKLLVTAHVDGTIKGWHNGPGLGGNDGLFMWQATKKLRFAPLVLCANEIDEVFFASDNYGYILGSLKDGRVWTSGSVKQNLLASSQDRGNTDCHLITAAQGGKHVIAIGTNDGSVITKSYRRADVSPSSALSRLNNFKEEYDESPITAVSVYDEHYNDQQHASNLSFAILAGTRDGLVKFMTKGNQRCSNNNNNGHSSAYRTKIYRLSTLLGIDETDLITKHIYPPRPTLYATSVLLGSHNRFAIGCSNGAVLVGTFKIKANFSDDDENNNNNTKKSNDNAEVDELSLEGLFFASSSVTAMSSVVPHSAGQQVISAGRDNDQKSKIESTKSRIVSRKGAPSFDICAGDSLGNLYRLEWREIVGVLTREENEEYFGMATAGGRAKSNEMMMAEFADDNNEIEDDDELSMSDDSDDQEEYERLMNNNFHDSSEDDDGDSTSSSDDDDSSSSSSTDTSSSSGSSSDNNFNKKKNLILQQENNNNNNKKSSKFKTAKQDSVWTQLKIQKVVLTGDSVMQQQQQQSKNRRADAANNSAASKKFVASEWADGRKFSVITQKPQRGWTAAQKKKLFMDQKIAFSAACALHRQLPAAKVALREHAQMTIQLFGAQRIIQN